MKISVFLLILVTAFCNAQIVMATPITNGDFSDPVDLAGFTTTGDTISEPTGEFAQLETNGAFQRTLEQTYTIPFLITRFSFDFAFSTEEETQSGFPDSFAVSMITTIDGDYLDILVVDALGVVPGPSDGNELITGATPISVSYNPSVTIAGFATFTGGINFSGRVSLWLPNEVLGEEATIYFDLLDESDGFMTRAAVDNISSAPIPEPGTIALLSIGLVGFLGIYGIRHRRNPAQQG